MQKKGTLLLTAAVLLMSLISGNLTAVYAKEAEKTTEVVVFAAASMTETLEEIAGMYEAEHPEVKLIFNFDSSGTLKTQIEEGADCDIFISAGQKQMDQLDIRAEEANPDRLDLADSDSRIDLLENKVVLCAADNSRVAVTSFDELAKALKEEKILLCMGNEDVPVGQYTRKILAYYDLDEEALAKAGCITYATNVKEVTTQILEESVDCGVIYGTDAFSAGLTPIDEASPEMCGQVIYPAAVMKQGLQPEAAAEFLEYLRTEEAMKVFESVGFSKVQTEEE